MGRQGLDREGVWKRGMKGWDRVARQVPELGQCCDDHRQLLAAQGREFLTKESGDGLRIHRLLVSLQYVYVLVQ